MISEDDPSYQGRHLWLARVTVSLLEGDEQRSYLIAAPDEMAAEYRVREYLSPAGGHLRRR